MLTTEVLSRRFMNFAEKECKGSSPLYEFLSVNIAKDNDLLEICKSARKGQPIPNLLFGSVHYLLRKGKEHSLRMYFPSIVDHPKPYNDSFADFKDFCLENRKEIELILQSRIVQTNEVRRCAYLYPAFCTIYEKVRKPLALLEIGTSAGLQLIWDNYSYSYGENVTYGNKHSNLHITTELKGENTPNFHTSPPPVSSRIGFDLNVVDLHDEDEALWLKSLIWPEHQERFIMFEAAAKYRKEASMRLVEGDGIQLLPKYVANIPADSVICIFHTHVANQLPLEAKKQLLQTIKAIGKERDVFHLYNNIQDQFLHLDYYLDGIEHTHTIAATDGHARSFEWFLNGKL